MKLINSILYNAVKVQLQNVSIKLDLPLIAKSFNLRMDTINFIYKSKNYTDYRTLVSDSNNLIDQDNKDAMAISYITHKQIDDVYFILNRIEEKLERLITNAT